MGRTHTLSLFLATAGGRKFWSDFQHQYPESFRVYINSEVLNDDENATA